MSSPLVFVADNVNKNDLGRKQINFRHNDHDDDENSGFFVDETKTTTKMMTTKAEHIQYARSSENNGRQ